jgi:protein-tyrosine phosphatase
MHKSNFKHSLPVLSGQHNFRDLGGIPVRDGRMIRRGLLFRSGDLHSITDADVSWLEELKLSVILDFRSDREREARPNRSIRTVKKVHHLIIHDDARDIAARCVETNDSVALETILVNEYRRITRDYRDVYRRFFRELMVHQNLPLVFHCSAGKDRTGLAAIFLLTALGADFNVILEDYFASNYFGTAMREKIIRTLTGNGSNGAIMRPMLEVRQEYLDAAMEFIRQEGYTMEQFVTEVLGADMIALQEMYLTQDIN